MNRSLVDFVWRGCDPQLAEAIRLFVERWEPFSIDSRRNSIFRLMREVIDPAWDDLQMRFHGMTDGRMHLAWQDYQWECLSAEPLATDTPTQSNERMTRIFRPCSGRIGGKYVLSEIGRKHGFIALERFLRMMVYSMEGCTNAPPNECFDSLQNLARGCHSKRSAHKSHAPLKDDTRKMNSRRSHLRELCEFCSQPTEFSAYRAGKSARGINRETDKLTFSSLYCSQHKARDSVTGAIRPAYLKVKRSESQYKEELERLDSQVTGGTKAAFAKSGNKMVDEYIRHLIGFHLRDAELTDSRLREEARELVYRRITDRKKEVVMLLAFGASQADVARQLGTSRQAISKVLTKVPPAYRFTSQALQEAHNLYERQASQADQFWEHLRDSKNHDFADLLEAQQLVWGGQAKKG